MDPLDSHDECDTRVEERWLRILVIVLAVVGALCVLPFAAGLVALAVKFALGLVGLAVGLICGLAGLAIGLVSAALAVALALVSAVCGVLLSPPGLVLIAIVVYLRSRE